jgi:NADH-quinone oxidoreductase subunit M
MTLALVLFLPLAGFLIAILAPRDSKIPLYSAVAASIAAFLASLGLIAPAIERGASFTSTLDLPWIEGAGFQIRFHLGVDGINLWLILLTTLLVPIGVWMTGSMVAERRKGFYALLLLFEFGLIGVFSALDLFVFYIFWEVALVPMYLMVGLWGGARR